MKLRIENTGFTLIEVAIAMGVLAVGLLGLASLQAVTIKSNASISYRAQATNLAHSIIDAMRVNNFALGNYVTAIESDPVCVKSSDNPLGLTGSIAKRDVDAWKNTLACVLPQGTGSIEVNGNAVTVTVQWNNSRNQTQTEQNSGQSPVEKIEVKTLL